MEKAMSKVADLETTVSQQKSELEKLRAQEKVAADLADNVDDEEDEASDTEKNPENFMVTQDGQQVLWINSDFKCP